MTAKAPEGYRLVPVVESAPASLRLCVVVKEKPEPAGGSLVTLRDLIDGVAYLACLADAGDCVHRWLEWWVQDLSNLGDTIAAHRQALTNRALDERWVRTFEAMQVLEPTAVVRTGWETEHPLPVWLDVRAGRAVHPTDRSSGGHWRLCTDDAVLSACGLPPYSGSLHRYLYLEEQGAESAFVAVTDGAPEPKRAASLSEIAGDGERLVPLNPGGGLVMAHTFSPIGLERYVEHLGGRSWEGVAHGRSVIDVDGLATQLTGEEGGDDAASNGHLFLGRYGRWGRLVETLHLKLRLIADAVRQVRSIVGEAERPVLNLTDRSFRVEMGPLGAGLPHLWTARARLTDGGDALVLPIQSSEARYFLPGRAGEYSVYRPESVSRPVSGRGTVRIRQVMDDGGGGSIVEGTFATQERIRPGRYDLVWLRLNLSGGRVDLYARLETETALAAGEWRFRTIGQRLTPTAARGLSEAEGVPLGDVSFELLPLLSTPCDLYALAVLAVRVLLVDERTSLPVALDETLSLARQVASDHDESVGLAARVHAILQGDGRWVQSLGPQHLTSDELSAEEALDLVPAELWCDVLGMVVRALPAIGPDSVCRDYGDAPPGGIHQVFEPMLADLERLLLRTRSLIVIDWRFNREVHAVIRRRVVEVGS